jgi:hypothetical protein
MTFPTATRKTAFIAGMSIAALAIVLGALKSHGLIPYDADSPKLFPFVIIYFFATTLIFVIDVRTIAPEQLKTKIPFIYFPTNREGVNFLFRVWGRMLFWFFGAVTATGLLVPLTYLLK